MLSSYLSWPTVRFARKAFEGKLSYPSLAEQAIEASQTMTTNPPLIGLSGRRKTAAQLAGTPEGLHHLEGDWYFADYARGVLAAGGLPVHLPLDADPALYIGRLDGILLSGGADVWPERYGATPTEAAESPEHERDTFELALLGAAAETRTPVLGICRGLQLINVFANGTLHQHVPEHAKYVTPENPIHDVEIAPASTLAGLYGTSHQVNSLHHQTIDRVGDGLTVTASHDGSVEGVEHTTLPILAVQWHPEMLSTRDTDPVFGWIVDQARTRSTGT